MKKETISKEGRSEGKIKSMREYFLKFRNFYVQKYKIFFQILTFDFLRNKNLKKFPVKGLKWLPADKMNILGKDSVITKS